MRDILKTALNCGISKAYELKIKDDISAELRAIINDDAFYKTIMDRLNMIEQKTETGFYHYIKMAEITKAQLLSLQMPDILTRLE